MGEWEEDGRGKAEQPFKREDLGMEEHGRINMLL